MIKLKWNDCLLISAFIMGTFTFAFTMWGVNDGSVAELNPFLKQHVGTMTGFMLVTVVWSVTFIFYLSLRNLCGIWAILPKALSITIFTVMWFDFWNDFVVMLLVIQ